MLSCEYYEFSKNMYFAKYPQTAASERTILCRMFRDMTSLACLRDLNAHQILLDKKSLPKRLHKMLTPENKRKRKIIYYKEQKKTLFDGQVSFCV